MLARQQILKEFEILSALSHPGIVRFSGIEEVDGLGLCVIMEWIEGPTLEESLMQGSLSRDDRRRLMFEIVEAVAYLHSKGVVHRDLKPSNIMVRQNGLSAVVIDFGLADTDAFTVLKYPAGTEGYASERQHRADTPDTSDDVYSLGVIMSSLYPEYGSIARRCKSSSRNRYANATKLLHAMRRRARLGLRIILAAVAAIIIGVIAVLGYHNAGLRSSVDNLYGQLSGLREDARHQETAAEQLRQRLSDSLTNIKKELAVETSYRTETERHDAHIAGLSVSSGRDAEPYTLNISSTVSRRISRRNISDRNSPCRSGLLKLHLSHDKRDCPNRTVRIWSLRFHYISMKSPMI